jgi:hypothetical protein
MDSDGLKGTATKGHAHTAETFTSLCRYRGCVRKLRRTCNYIPNDVTAVLCLDYAYVGLASVRRLNTVIATMQLGGGWGIDFAILHCSNYCILWPMRFMESQVRSADYRWYPTFVYGVRTCELCCHLSPFILLQLILLTRLLITHAVVENRLRTIRKNIAASMHSFVSMQLRMSL